MWRVIDVAGDGYGLICHQGHFVALKDKEEKLRIHFSDINCIIAHSYLFTISGVLMQKLIEHNIPLIICDQAHNPAGLLLQTFKHSEYGNRINCQIKASKPLLKKAWKQIIEIKIKNQAQVLLLAGKKKENEILIKYYRTVKSGDSTNREATASRVYFHTLFDDFRRNPEGNDIVNSCLNYAYAILRSNVARSIVGAGLNPALGIFHSYKNNYFCLVDDLMEPLRPFIDIYIKENITIIAGNTGLTPDLKKMLAAILNKKYSYNGEVLEIGNLIQKYVLSYFDYLSKVNKEINIPEL